MVKKETTPSQEFSEREKIAKLELSHAKIRHGFRMKELEFHRESDNLHHERELTRRRIKSAEIRKHLQHKDALRMSGGYRS